MSYSYSHSFVSAASATVILAVVMFFMPESPFYLVTKGRYDEAEKSLQWLRGKDYNPKHDVEVLKQAQEDEKATGAVTVKELLTKRRYLQPLLIVVGLMFFQQFSGVNFVIFYTQEIFVDAGSDLDQGEYDVILIVMLCTPRVGVVLTLALPSRTSYRVEFVPGRVRPVPSHWTGGAGRGEVWPEGPLARLHHLHVPLPLRPRRLLLHERIFICHMRAK